MDDGGALLFAFVGFSTIAAMTWFFSSRPHLFVRMFVPKAELRTAVRTFLKKPEEFRQGFRLIAELQYGVAFAFGLAWLWNWLCA